MDFNTETISEIDLAKLKEKVKLAEKSLKKRKKLSDCLIDDEDKDSEEIIKELKKDITNRFMSEIQRDKILLKSNKLIYGKDFKFVGYSSYDELPIYESISDDINQLIDFDVVLINVKAYEVSTTININDDVDYVIIDAEFYSDDNDKFIVTI